MTHDPRMEWTLADMRFTPTLSQLADQIMWPQVYRVFEMPRTALWFWMLPTMENEKCE